VQFVASRVSVPVAVSQRRRKRRRKFARTAAWAVAIALIPTQVAFQDLGALLAHQPGVTERAHEFILNSPFGTIHTATFSLPHPIGTRIPHPPIYALADFDPFDIARSIGAQLLGDPNGPAQFPAVNRKDKRDSLLHRRRAPLPPLPPALPIEPLPLAQADRPLKGGGAIDRFDPYSQYEFAPMLDASVDRPAATTHTDRAPPKAAAAAPPDSKEAARVYFSTAPLIDQHETLRPYAPGQAPVVKALTVSGDPQIKLAALTPSGDKVEGGESVANKGVVTGVDQRPASPAERLHLIGKARARAEKCLANAVYFESRDEPVRAQIAVAQVVMNRVFSPFYPNDVCGVVYQNADRHLACQFTFACDGIPDVVTEPDAWARAEHIARDVLDGKLWLPEVAKSTHYHDDWAHPAWVGEMRRIDKLGGLIFYRPRAWGDGADEPSWSTPATTARETKIIKKM
jgi:spore germination cell wall hydrolase CwlJ-like protein